MPRARLSYWVHDRIVTADTMFVNGCGRCDLVKKLPSDTVMLPGHKYGATPSAALDQQLQEIPWLQHPTIGDFVAHRMAGKTANTSIPLPPWPPDGPLPGKPE